jgi:enoyl-CoA hydratase
MHMPIKAEDLVRKAKEFVEYKKDKKTKIAYLTFNRPDHFNATSVGMRLLYGDLIHRANIDDDVKVLVIRGAGDHFGTGGDLDEQNGAYTEGAEGVDSSLLHEFEIDDPDVKYPQKNSFRYIHGLCEHYAKARGGCRSLQEFKKISIVEAKGYCYGWHFYQTGDADLVVSSEDALFGHPAFRYVGVAPRLWTWVELIGLRKFQEMLFTGRPFTAKEMADCGFVNSVVPREKLEEETLKFATACSLTRPVDTVAVQKTFLEIYKQYRGEYMGSLLTSMVEGLWPYMRHEPGDVNFGAAMGETNIASIVKTRESSYPAEWRMSRSGRKRK